MNMKPESWIFEPLAAIARAHAESVTLEPVCSCCLKKCELTEVAVTYPDIWFPPVQRTERRSACCQSGYIYDREEV